MTTELEIIRTFWPIIYAVAAAALVFVVWLIRLEGKQKSNHEKIVQVEKMQETEGHRDDERHTKQNGREPERYAGDLIGNSRVRTRER